MHVFCKIITKVTKKFPQNVKAKKKESVIAFGLKPHCIFQSPLSYLIGTVELLVNKPLLNVM